jgi:hypothetical protein
MTWGKGIASPPESQNSRAREENCDETSPGRRNNASGGMILLSSFFRQSMTYECDQFGDLEKPIRVHSSQSGENFLIPLAISMLAGNNNRQNVEVPLHSKKRTLAPHEHLVDHRPSFTERSW